MYHSAHTVQAEIEARRPLTQAVEAWWQEKGWGIPNIPPRNGHPLGILARHVATFRYEDALFVLLAEQAGLEPVWLEYTGDRFADVSPFKHSLGRPVFCTRRGRNGGYGLTGLHEIGIRGRKSLFDFTCANGRPINGLRIFDGRPLVDFHHDRQDQMTGNTARRFDLTTWLRQIGSAKDYYEAYLSLFVAHGVLFEDYHGGESAGQDDKPDVLFDFTAKIFEPSWQAVCQRFGLEPLIVPLPWYDYCRYYPLHPDWRDNGVILPEHLAVS